VIICTYNPDDRNYNKTFDNFQYIWFNVIRSWIIQRSNDLQVDIVISDNVSGPKTRAKLIEFQQQNKGIYIDFVNEWFSNPFICFNNSLSFFKNSDSYDYYAYCASDANFNKKGDLQVLLDDMDEKCCFISPQANRDMIQRLDINQKKTPTKIICGEAVNNHLSIWTREFMEAYDYKYVDIVGGPRNEGFYPYACAAIECHELMSHKVCINHRGRTDRKKLQPLLMSQYKRDFFQMLKEGQKIGLGFEEVLENMSLYMSQFLNNPRLGPYYLVVHIFIKYIVLTTVFKSIFDLVNAQNIIPKKIVNFVEELQGKPYVHRHNPDCFNENGYAKTDDLYHFIKQNLFLTKDELDYEKINHELYYPK